MKTSPYLNIHKTKPCSKGVCMTRDVATTSVAGSIQKRPIGSTKYWLNGKRITKKQALEICGETIPGGTNDQPSN